ncbi:hypothetical protein DBB29_24870 [Pandoraea cepalis]|uniref:DUF3717 domain-containing protein n=1 Tax=Pandoraea cepalis TaxID=2508294 RepID=A0AAW7MGR5_9BURK|nr:DUF3717 domain-containing protein [Pandoraea cepalis]MDN4571895.1 hypothetical protein [Pandoraea cepalis]MDN4581349.1 hypothetical protein [Pandoraea cepalis]
MTISEIERAINYWLKVDPTGPDYAICAQAAALGKHYGQMIYERRTSIGISELTGDARRGFEVAESASGY